MEVKQSSSAPVVLFPRPGSCWGARPYNVPCIVLIVLSEPVATGFLSSVSLGKIRRCGYFAGCQKSRIFMWPIDEDGSDQFERLLSPGADSRTVMAADQSPMAFADVAIY
ncbi:hypothetical protein ACJZ2D_008292 [Fusarium nematophilum]